MKIGIKTKDGRFLPAHGHPVSSVLKTADAHSRVTGQDVTIAVQDGAGVKRIGRYKPQSNQALTGR